jgi:uncharacterized membrane protein YfcA
MAHRVPTHHVIWIALLLGSFAATSLFAIATAAILLHDLGAHGGYVWVDAAATDPIIILTTLVGLMAISRLPQLRYRRAIVVVFLIVGLVLIAAVSYLFRYSSATLCTPLSASASC